MNFGVIKAGFRFAFEFGRTGGVVPPTPPPVLVTPPLIDPTSGMVGDTFVAIQAVVTGATFNRREWLLNSTIIGTGATIVPSDDGSLVLREYWTGDNGRPYIYDSAAATVEDSPQTGPVNIIKPWIEGVPVDETAWILHVGVWSGDIDHFDVEWRNASDDSVVLSRRLADPDEPAEGLGDVVGLTLYARVWAVSSTGAETFADTDAFGPVVAAGDEFIIALAWAPTEQSLPQSPYPWTAVTVEGGSWGVDYKAYPQPNPNHASLSWGRYGDIAMNVQGTGTTTGDAGRLQGRLGSNLSAAQFSIAIQVPEVGATYRVYAGMKAHTNVIGMFAVRDGSASGPELYVIDNTSGTTSSTQVKDAAANITSITDWAAASDLGGHYIEVTPTIDNGDGTATLVICRPSTNAAVTHLNCVAVTKKREA